MIKTVLFDLDGTLLPLEQEEFAHEYFKNLCLRIGNLVDSKKFIQQLLSSTEAMVKSGDKDKTNQQVFFEDFMPNIGIAAEVLEPIFDDFYENDFVKVKPVTRPSMTARQAVMAATELGLEVVLATNPIFPLNAVKQRIQWAGLADVSFKHITSYEDCHFCKPNPEYYWEILECIGRRPEECLMVGNDVEEDLAAAKTGMKTYLVTDCLINAKKLDFRADYQGTLQELAQNITGIINAENGSVA